MMKFSRPRPLPIPDPPDEPLASTCEFETKTEPITEEVSVISENPLPIPEPSNSLFATIVDSLIATLSIAETEIPIPQY
jgi:hypothetical protein